MFATAECFIANNPFCSVSMLLVQVFGACLMDFEDLAVRRMLIDETKKIMALAQGIFPSSQLLVHPPFDTTLNITGFGLGVSHVNAWRDHFFKRAYTRGEVQVGEFESHPYNPLARCFSVVAMTWTYDTSLQLVPRSEEML